MPCTRQKIKCNGNNLEHAGYYQVIIDQESWCLMFWCIHYSYGLWELLTEGYSRTIVDFFRIHDMVIPANGYTSKLVPIQTNWSENSQSNSASSKNLKMGYHFCSFHCLNKPSRECFAKENNVGLQPAATGRTNWVPVQHNLLLDLVDVCLLLTVGTSCRCKGTMGLNDLVLG